MGAGVTARPCQARAGRVGRNGARGQKERVGNSAKDSVSLPRTGGNASSVSCLPPSSPRSVRISPESPPQPRRAAEVSTPLAMGAWHWLPADGGGAGGGARPSRSRARPAPLTTSCASLDQSL